MQVNHIESAPFDPQMLKNAGIETMNDTIKEAAFAWQYFRNALNRRMLDLAEASGWLSHMTLNDEDRNWLTFHEPVPVEVAKRRMTKARADLAKAYEDLIIAKRVAGCTQTNRMLLQEIYQGARKSKGSNSLNQPST